MLCVSSILRSGGIESVVRELASAQVAAGHRVRVVTLNRVFKATQDQVLPARGRS